MKNCYFLLVFLFLFSFASYGQNVYQHFNDLKGKQISIDKEIFKFDPLDIGNKWVYDAKSFIADISHNFIYSREIIRDSTLENGEIFKLIRLKQFSPNTYSLIYTFERVDSLTGKVYSWNLTTKSEFLIDDLNINLGDTIDVLRYIPFPGIVVFDSLNFKSIFGLTKENHEYHSMSNPSTYGDIYSLTKDFGLTYRWEIYGQTDYQYILKGAVIKGVEYGDTNFVVGIKDKSYLQPKEYTLFQNYPNPFNPVTTINYSLAKAENVKLTIYNAIGCKVVKLVDGYKPAGKFSINFNGDNLSSGIYFYKLEAGNFSQIKKMILIK